MRANLLKYVSARLLPVAAVVVLTAACATDADSVAEESGDRLAAPGEAAAMLADSGKPPEGGDQGAPLTQGQAVLTCGEDVEEMLVVSSEDVSPSSGDDLPEEEATTPPDELMLDKTEREPDAAVSLPMPVPCDGLAPDGGQPVATDGDAGPCGGDAPVVTTEVVAPSFVVEQPAGTATAVDPEVLIARTEIEAPPASPVETSPPCDPGAAPSGEPVAPTEAQEPK